MGGMRFVLLLLATLLSVPVAAGMFSAAFIADFPTAEHTLYLPLIASAGDAAPPASPTPGRGTPSATPEASPGAATPTPTATATERATETPTPTSTPSATPPGGATGTLTPTPTETRASEPGSLLLISKHSNGTPGNGESTHPALSANAHASVDGRYVAFESLSTNLAPGNTGGHRQIYVHDRQLGQTKLVSVDGNGTPGNGHSYRPSTSADGQFIAFHSEASNLVDVDTNGFADVFLYVRERGDRACRVARRHRGDSDIGSA